MKAEAAVFVIRLKIIIFCDANQRKSDFLWTFLFLWYTVPLDRRGVRWH